MANEVLVNRAHGFVAYVDANAAADNVAVIRAHGFVAYVDANAAADNVAVIRAHGFAVYLVQQSTPTKTRRHQNANSGVWEFHLRGTPVLEATEGEAYAGFTVTKKSGTDPIAYSLLGTWPAGISIDPDTGVVSGTPTESGTFAGLSVRGTDDAAATADLAVGTLEVASGAAITDLGDHSIVTDLFTYSFPGCALGAEAADRVIIVHFTGRSSVSGSDIPAVTIGGVAAEVGRTWTGGTPGILCGLAWALVPSGTTGGVVLTFANLQRYAAVTLSRMTGHAPNRYDDDTDTVSGGAAATATLALPPDAVVVAAAQGQSATDYVWAGATEISDFTPETYRHSASHGEFAAAAAHDITATPNANNTYLSAASFSSSDYPYRVAHTTITHVVATSQNRVIPAKTEADDLLIAVVMHRDTLTPPAGWTLVDSQSCEITGFTQWTSVYKRTALPGDAGANTTWTQATSQRLSVQIMAFRAGGRVLDVLASAKTSQSFDTTNSHIWDMASVAATANGQLALSMASSLTSKTGLTITPSAGFVFLGLASDDNNRLATALKVRDLGETSAGTFTSNNTPTLENGIAAVSVIIG